MMNAMKLHLHGITLNDSRWRDDAHPFRVPAVQHVKKHGLNFKSPVTFFVGENGSGKTTLLEAIVARYPRTGAWTPYSKRVGVELSLEDAPLGWNVELERPRDATAEGFFLRASTLGGLIGDLEREAVPEARATRLVQRSHGEGLLGVLNAHFESRGMYFLDEPETALSFRATLGVLSLLHSLARNGSQVICATHSPVLLALPGAQILEFGDHGLREVARDDLELMRDWRSFLNDPDVFLRYLLEP
jgi:predicted ATPase